MGSYQKFLIIMAIVAIGGIAIFVIDFSDLSWNNNRESYWGVIAMLALIGSILMTKHSQKIEKKIKDLENKKDQDLA